jgi:hypothetical protein
MTLGRLRAWKRNLQGAGVRCTWFSDRAGQRQHVGDDHLVAEAPVEAENAGGVDIVSPATPGDAALPICP